ncbi:hypothetical protein [uncultured Draconibacterium sp.]|uniref:hypothetical protein n=1 Tax=uncultured Draconibacterium sp. TaxID=1573823 RepID=UPI0032173BB1
MDQKDKIDIHDIKDSLEKEVLLYLDRKGKCIYGEIIKNLKLPTTKGQETIYSLLNKGLIRHQERSSLIELNVEIGE